MGDIWILHNGAIDGFISQTTYEIEKYLKEFGVNVKTYSYNSIKFKKIDNEEFLTYQNQPLNNFPKVVFARGNCYKLMHYLHKKGVIIINNFTNMLEMKDKWQTYLNLQNLGIKQPKTIYNKTVIPFEDVERTLSVPFIVKYRFGAQGKSVFLVNTKQEYLNIISKYYFDDLILQEFVKTSFGRDIRIFVVGNKFFGAIRDNSRGEDFRANLAQGGVSVGFEIPKNLNETIQKIVKELNYEIVGLDFLFDKNDYSFCEANGNAGYKAFTSLGIDMSKIIAEYIFDKYFKENN